MPSRPFIRSAFASILALVVSIPPVLAADEEPSLEVEEVLISTTRLPAQPVDVRTVPSKVTVITAEDIARSGAQTLQEALLRSTGLVMYDALGNNFEQTIDLRGFNAIPGPSTTVFVDGVRMNQPGLNQINWDLIPLESVQRIEILPGPGAIFGRNALAGVINITTKTGTARREATGGMAFGSYERQRYLAQTSGPLGDFTYHTSVAREFEKGYREDSEARLSRFFGKMGYAPSDDTEMSVGYTYVKDRLEQAGSLPLSLASDNPRANFTPGDVLDREDNLVRFNGRHRLGQGLSVTGNLFYRRLQQASFIVSQPFVVGGPNSTSQNTPDLETWGGVLQASHESTPLGMTNTLVVGGELSWTTFGSKLLSQGAVVAQNSTDEEVSGAYIQDTLALTPQVLLSGGLRYDSALLEFEDNLAPANNRSIRFERVTPRAGLTYLIGPETSAYFSYAQGFRIPNNNELFALGPFGSNPDLQAVRSSNFEVGFKSSIWPAVSVELALFQTDVRDEIFFTCLACDFSFGDGQNRNVPETRRRGIEGTARIRPTRSVEGVVNYTFTEATFESPFVLGFGGGNAQTIDVGDSLPLVPKHRLNVTLTLHPVEGVRLSLNGLYVSTQFFQGDESNSRERLAGYFLLNGQAAYTRPVPGGTLDAFLRATNLLDTEYFTSGIIAANRITGGGAIERFVVPAPGVAVYGGISYRFDGFPE